MTQRPWSSSFDRETRQQLDELDALIQRMLALPMEPPDHLGDAPIEKAANENSSENTAVSSEANSWDLPAISVQAEQPVEQGGPEVYATAAPVPSASGLQEKESLSHSPEHPPAENEAPVRAPSLQFGNQASRSISAQDVRGVRPRWPMYPLRGFNLAFDQATGWLGPPGHWLRGPGGRALLGWWGLLLLAAALAWLVWDGLGWTW